MKLVVLEKGYLETTRYPCSGRSGARWQYGVPEWYEIVERLRTPAINVLEFGCLELAIC